MTKYFLFDCETGGLPESEASLLTFCGLVLNEKLECLGKINVAVRPDERGLYKVQPAALNINRINLLEHTEKAVTEKTAKEELMRFLVTHRYKGDGKLTPVGQNVDFDIFFLKRLLGEKIWSKSFSRRVIDLASVAQFLKLAGKLPEELNCSLESLANHFNLSYAGAHNAEFDATLTLDILRYLLILVKDKEGEL